MLQLLPAAASVWKGGYSIFHIAWLSCLVGVGFNVILSGKCFLTQPHNPKSSTGACFIFCITYYLFPSQNLSQSIWYCFISSLFMLACVFIISFLSVISNILQSLHFLHALLKLQHAGVHCRDENTLPQMLATWHYICQPGFLSHFLSDLKEAWRC